MRMNFFYNKAIPKQPRIVIFYLILCGVIFHHCSNSKEELESTITDASKAEGKSQTDASITESKSDNFSLPTDQMATSPKITFYSDSGDMVTQMRYGDLIGVKVTGLIPKELITIHARLWGYTSEAEFIADEKGMIDLSKDTPVKGTYSDVDADGMFWSMIRKSDQRGTSYDVDFSIERDGAIIAQATINRLPLNANLNTQSVNENGLLGTFFTPKQGGKVPAVLVLGGSEGGLNIAEFNAAYIASLGYAALGLAYFGIGSLPQGLTEIPLEYFESALKWLAQQPGVDANRLAVAGVSRGGELALILGAQYPQIHAVIAEVPSNVRWGSASVKGKAAWTLDGKPLAYLSGDGTTQATVETLPDGKIGYRLTPIFQAAIDKADPATLASVTIPVEQIQGHILLIGGADDGVWPSCGMAKIAMDRLTNSGHSNKYTDEFLCFKDAGHMIGTPGFPTTESYAYYVASAGYYRIMGGTPAGIGKAQRIYDKKLRNFLQKLH